MKTNILTLEMAVDDALHRIRTAYKNANGNIYLSFSGGKDSTIVAELIKMTGLTDIPLVFANTGIELDATLRFVKNYDYPNITIQKAEKPFVQVAKEYGYPVLSKMKSEMLRTYQRNDDPFSTARIRQFISGDREIGGIKTGQTITYKLANKHMNLIHPDHEYKIANKCCEYMKKRPFNIFVKNHGKVAYLSGIRLAEGGARSLQYKSCTVKNGKLTHTMPIIDWSDEICDEFIAKYNIKLSDAYTVYGAKRTGCIACPFSQTLSKDLKMLWEYEPLKYKASMKMLKHVFVDQNIVCEWDDDYMAYYNERRPIVEARRLEMLKKYRPDAKELNKQSTT